MLPNSQVRLPYPCLRHRSENTTTNLEEAATSRLLGGGGGSGSRRRFSRRAAPSRRSPKVGPTPRWERGGVQRGGSGILLHGWARRSVPRALQARSMAAAAAGAQGPRCRAARCVLRPLRRGMAGDRWRRRWPEQPCHCVLACRGVAMAARVVVWKGCYRPRCERQCPNSRLS